MPISLPALNRRRFFQTTAMGAAALCLGQDGRGDDARTDPRRFALLADTHVAGDRATEARGVNMFENLQRVCAEIRSLVRQPAAMLIDGDCAYTTGTREDYATLMELIRPVREAGLPVHLALGNHDHRERFWEAAGQADREASQLPEKHVLLLPTPEANWFLLDSLDATNKTPGVLGEPQLSWLAETLDAAKDKPALVMVHHNPDTRPQPSGLTDTAALLGVLTPRRHVKALFFGHTHVWDVREQDGLHLVNLPPVAYVFAREKPNGWVDCQLSAAGAKLQLHCLDPEHAKHGQQMDLAWRA